MEKGQKKRGDDGERIEEEGGGWRTERMDDEGKGWREVRGGERLVKGQTRRVKLIKG